MPQLPTALCRVAVPPSAAAAPGAAPVPDKNASASGGMVAAGPAGSPGDPSADLLWTLGNRSTTSRRKLQSAMLFAPPPQDLPRRRRLTAGSGSMFGRVGQWARGLWAHVGGLKQVQPLQPPPLPAGHHISHDTHPRLLREFLGLADGEVTHPRLVSIHLPLLRNSVQALSSSSQQVPCLAP